MSATDDSRAVPAWKLERYVLGELPADELTQLRRLVENDPELRRRVEALKADDARILASYPPRWIGRQLRAAARPARSEAGASWWPRAAWPVPLAAAALLVLAALPVLRPDAPTPSGAPAAMDAARSTEEGVRIKGTGARLLAHRKAQVGSERLMDGARAREGDLVRLQYDAGGAGWGAILSIDGRGAVTRHLPLTGDRAARLEAGGVTALPTAYQLDDAPRWERFYLISAAEPFELAGVLTAARRAAATALEAGTPPDSLRLPAGLEQAGLTLAKVESHR